MEDQIEQTAHNGVAQEAQSLQRENTIASLLRHEAKVYTYMVDDILSKLLEIHEGEPLYLRLARFAEEIREPVVQRIFYLKGNERTVFQTRLLPAIRKFFPEIDIHKAEQLISSQMLSLVLRREPTIALAAECQNGEQPKILLEAFFGHDKTFVVVEEWVDLLKWDGRAYVNTKIYIHEEGGNTTRITTYNANTLSPRFRIYIDDRKGNLLLEASENALLKPPREISTPILAAYAGDPTPKDLEIVRQPSEVKQILDDLRSTVKTKTTSILIPHNTKDLK